MSRPRIGWVVALVAILAAWQAWVRLRDVPDYLLPAPSEVGRFGRPAMPGEIAGTRTNDAPEVDDLAGDEPGVLQWSDPQ